MEVAAGAAIAGARSLVTMKQVGLNVASDPLMSLNYVGVKAGMVIVCCDDPGPISSQTEQDTRRFGQFAKLSVFDPSTPEEAYQMVGDAFSLSERLGRPVILRPTTRVCHAYASVELQDDLARGEIDGFTKDDGRWVIFPKLAHANKLLIEQEQADLSVTLSSYPGNALFGDADAKIGIACGGVSACYVREALEILNVPPVILGEVPESNPLPPFKLLKVSAYPFPSDTATDFLDGLDEVLVVEELDPVIEDELVKICGIKNLDVKILGKRDDFMPFAGENTVDKIVDKLKVYFGIQNVNFSDPVSKDGTAGQKRFNFESQNSPLPVRPPVLCAGCPHRSSFFAVKKAMKGRAAVYCGDIGCYTLGNAQPLDMTDTCLCMGAGLTQAQGIALAEKLKAGKEAENLFRSAVPPLDTGAEKFSASFPDTPVCFAFIGDSTFFHTGIPGVVNAVFNNHSVVFCVLDNSTTAMTGGQTHPGLGKTLLHEDAPRISIEAIIRACGVSNVQKVSAFDFVAAKSAVKAAVNAEGVRVIIFEGPCINIVEKKPALTVDVEKCISCGLCMKEVGCPALSYESRDEKSKVKIDEVLCTACGLCKVVCPADAIGNGE
jgi:indolepyruvate ferredoxin oxidoreductase alpha subunit